MVQHPNNQQAICRNKIFFCYGQPQFQQIGFG